MLATALVAAAGLSSVVVPGVAFAEGSRDFYPNDATCTSTGSCRANIEWRTNSYGPAGSTILRRTLFTVFATRGEILELGSSAVGSGSGDIVVWNPGRIADDQEPALPAITSGRNGFTCSHQRSVTGSTTAGMITTRAQEKAGPQSVTGGHNSTGYVPCHYQVPTTGLYKVAFYGPTGQGSTADGSPSGDLDLASSGDFDGSQGTSVAAWDLTVRSDDASTADITGRVFTYALAAFTGGNGRPIDQTLYATTLDGYEYKVDTNGLDPNGFVIYGNEQGFLDPEGNPLNHDVLGNGSQMTAVEGGVKLAPPTYPISFSKLSQVTLDALHIDDTPVRPALTNLEFDGANTGSNTYAGRGGTFTFHVATHGTYNLVISRDGTDFDPTRSTNRVLRGVVEAGSRSVTWDGKDNAGNAFPAGRSYAVRAEVRGGVYHFPLLDAENSTKGGPSFTLLNPPGGTCPFGNASCTTSFYDDRGYHTSAGDVGVPGQVLGGDNAPLVDHADVFTGYDSTTNKRAWGSATGGARSFGDAKGLDSWTYFPSATRSASLNVLAVPDAPVAHDDTASTTVGRAVTLHPLANDLGTGLAVTSVSPVSRLQPAFVGRGAVKVRGDSVVYTPARGVSGRFRFTYTVRDAANQRTQAVATVTVDPRAVDDSDWTPNGTPVVLAPLANDLGSRTRVESVTKPAHGTVLPVGDRLMFAPDYGYVGTTSFRYTLRDAAGLHSTARVSVRIKPSDPEVRPDDFTTDPGKPVTFDPTVNDPGRGSFYRSSLVLVDGSAHRSVRTLVTPAGTFTVARRTGVVAFVPARGYVGRVWNATYLVADRAGRLHRSTIMVHIGDQAGVPGRRAAGGLKPGREVVAATGTGSTGLKPGRVIKGELPNTGNPVGPALPLAGAVLIGIGTLLLRRRPSR